MGEIAMTRRLVPMGLIVGTLGLAGCILPDPGECNLALVLTPNSDGSVHVDWEPFSMDTQAYSVGRRAEGETDFTFLALLANTTTEYTDETTEPNTAYAYRVIGHNGESLEDNTGCAEGEVTAIPEFPTLAAGALAVAGGVLGFTALRRGRRPG